jgi:hypothetical protein
MKVELLDEPTAFEPVGEFLARFTSGTVLIDDPVLPYVMRLVLNTERGMVDCTEVAYIRRRGGPPIGPERQREIRIPELRKLAVARLLFRLRDPDRGMDGGVEPIPLPDVTIEPGGRRSVRYGPDTPFDEMLDLVDWAAASEVGVTTAVRPRGNRIHDDELRQYADLVRSCGGGPYMRLVMEVMRLSPDQARKWRRKAIERGFLKEDNT